MNMTVDDFNKTFGAYWQNGASNGVSTFTDQELRMWVVELMASDGYVDLTHAEQVFKYIKTGEV